MLAANHISVSFPGVKALDDVSVEFKPNRVHAVLGANGSGKSTLVKFLTGVYQPDRDCGSEINIDGTVLGRIENPSVAYDLGIRVVHQETPLIDTFTIAECVALFKGYPKNRFGNIDWKHVYDYVTELFEVFNIGISPKTLTTNLKASERNMIAMAIAIGKGEELKRTKALILDEADASIPEAEAEFFLEHVRKIADMGIPVITVTHRLKEIKKICDDVTILNGGKVVFSGLSEEATEEVVIANMLKKHDDTADELKAADEELDLVDIWKMLDRKPHEDVVKTVLEFKDVQAKNIDELSFTVKNNEIIGFVGLGDSGVGELPSLLGGMMQRKSGDFVVNGHEMPMSTSPRILYRKGLNMLPCDRIRNGGIMSCSLRDNMLMPNEIKFWHNRKLAKKVMKTCINVFDVNPGHDMNMKFGKFSGGNQQKAILAKWLSLSPSVFVLDDPTYGVDPASRITVFEAIKSASENHVGVVIFSTEPEQLALICTRVIVLQHGKIAAELTHEDGSLTRESVARWCYA